MHVTREQVVAYRIAEQGMHRTVRDHRELPLLDLGVQDTANATARIALAARLREPARELHGITLIWSYRGAPHLHRSGEIPALAAALWPLSEADGESKMAWQRSRFAATTGMSVMAALTVTARAMREQVPTTLSKGAVSAAVTQVVPAGLSYWCRGCGTTHILEQLMRLAALPAGIRLETDRYPATLAPIPQWPGVPDRSSGVERRIESYLRFLGPATPKEVAGFLGSTAKELRPHWPGNLSEVDVDGRRGWLPTDRLDALGNPPEPPRVRLLPAMDPYLQARDRDLIVPEKAAQKQLWRVLGNPGALLIDGEVAGVWRTRARGRRLDITITPFGMLEPGLGTDIEREAGTIAAVRGSQDVTVRIEGE